MTTINILYFASLAEQLDCSQEELAWPNSKPMADLKQVLAERGPAWAKQFTEPTLHCAINQNLVSDDELIKPGDEVAFFPPVTGG